MADVLDGIKNSNNITQFESSGNIIGDDSACKILQIFKTKVSVPLKELQLNYAGIATKNLVTILKSLYKYSSLEKIGLAGLKFDEVAVNYLLQILRKHKDLYFVKLSKAELMIPQIVNVLKILYKFKSHFD